MKHDDTDHGTIEIIATNPADCKWLKIGDKEHYVYFDWQKSLIRMNENMSEIILIDNFIVDGYHVGGSNRLLEGVKFSATIIFDTDEIDKSKIFTPKTIIALPFAAKDENYLLSLGGPGAMEYWCNETVSHIRNNIGYVLDTLDDSDPCNSKLFELNEKYG